MKDEEYGLIICSEEIVKKMEKGEKHIRDACLITPVLGDEVVIVGRDDFLDWVYRRCIYSWF